MNKNDQQFMAEKIRTQYMEKQASELDELVFERDVRQYGHYVE